MMEWLEYLTSPKGMLIVDGLASAFFLAEILIAVFTRRINLGSAIPRIQRSESPRAYWSVLALYGLIVAWLGVTAASGLLKN